MENENKEIEATISFTVKIEEDFLEELERIVDHHMEYLINTDEFPEFKTIYNANVKEI